MASNSPPPPSPSSSSRSDPPLDPSTKKVEETSPAVKDVLAVIESLKKQVAAKRIVTVKNRVEENRQKLIAITNQIWKSSAERTCGIADTDRGLDLLSKRQKEAIDMHNGVRAGNDDGESNGYNGDDHGSTAVLLGSNYAVKNAVRPIKLPEVKRLPPYTTWIFLDRNQRMTEDQSVLGRRRIYYDQNGGEALICSDSEEELIDEEEEKREFVESEDFILRMTIREFGLSDVVLEILAQCFSRKTSDIKARYETFCNEDNSGEDSKNGDAQDNSQIDDSFLEKDLEAALDSFDNLFCRRCRVFDCRLHGCSQDLVFPAERQPLWTPPNTEDVPCGPNCFRTVLKAEKMAKVTSTQTDVEDKSSGGALSRKKSSGRRRIKCSQSESASSNARIISESSDSENGPGRDAASGSHSAPPKTKPVGKSGIGKRNSKRVAERVLVCMQKRQKKTVASDSDSISEAPDRSLNDMVSDPHVTSGEDNTRKEEFVDESISKQDLADNKSWKTLEKGLLEKGMEIFGKNSCLIARNLLNGLKTCWDVFQYINCEEGKLSGSTGDATNSLVEGYSKGNNEVRRRSKFLRRRGRVRRLKYTWKSAAYHSIRKRITERKDQPCRQYNPCGCQSACGKECPCLLNGTCCEKYCGCPKSCKNRFRGCHCAKSQCRSRQCPCFAADRECDPDVCRNCWVSSCGDGTLGIPSQRGDNYECRNMKLLLKQQQKVLLGRSDVSGWGAFLKVNGLPFNKYSWIMTHNSFSIMDAPSLNGVQRLTFYNQEDTVTNQLRNGVRGLMLDMYDFQNDIWLCHSFQGQCYNFTAFQPAINTLKEVEAFLTENPMEIVTIVIEDYVRTPKALINLFINAGLDKYLFPVSDMPKNGEDWPTITQMAQTNRRLLVFTSDASKEAEEGIAYQWRYMIENESGDPGVHRGSCPHRKESKPLNSRTASLFLQNYFPTTPVEAESCKENSAPLADMVNTCYKTAGNVLPNFIAVNFYMRSDGGGVFDIVDRINGHALCGCSTVTACQVGAPFGSCKNISVPSTSPMTNTAGSYSGYVQFSVRSASPVHSPNCSLFLLFYFLLTAVMLQFR